ncbi:hypothetical protein ONE63_008104 [Megalurothrips usitatus]|uniref:Uncharacterized protein n=1 Tax=Megalurothrips usitatus TaxID=439358 RepID=A0AAV7XSN4_9NEOP|nr:hypothetical protein ONE63_008104 [Megalurothrips usitatus]
MERQNSAGKPRGKKVRSLVLDPRLDRKEAQKALKKAAPVDSICALGSHSLVAVDDGVPDFSDFGAGVKYQKIGTSYASAMYPSWMVKVKLHYPLWAVHYWGIDYLVEDIRKRKRSAEPTGPAEITATLGFPDVASLCAKGAFIPEAELWSPLRWTTDDPEAAETLECFLPFFKWKDPPPEQQKSPSTAMDTGPAPADPRKRARPPSSHDESEGTQTENEEASRRTARKKPRANKKPVSVEDKESSGVPQDQSVVSVLISLISG